LADRAVTTGERTPRLLFITPAAFNRITGGGITFTNLFAGWPRDRIATIHCDPVPPTDEVCERYYALSPRELRRFPPVRSRIAGGAGGAATVARPRSLLAVTKDLIFGNGLPEWGVVTPELRAFVTAFRPEVIYTILGSNAVLDIIDAIRRESGARLAIHFMDDWPAAIYRGGLLSFVQRGKMRRLLRGLVGKAALRLAIGDAMAAEYAQLYGAPFRAFQNAVATDRVAALRRDIASVGQPARLVYTGSVLGFAQAASLAACCRAAAALRRDGLDLRVDIYSPSFQLEPLRPLFAVDPCITLNETIGDDDTYFRVLAEADLLLLPANFDAASMRYIRLSMPTKLPAYLASGTPILVYGPTGLAQVDDATREGWGLVADQPSPEALQQAMRRLLSDAELRRSLSARARRLAAARHDIAKVRRDFQRTLASTAW
jgi:glycosyltransferase involved in cell wall biosynthesis